MHTSNRLNIRNFAHSLDPYVIIISCVVITKDLEGACQVFCVINDVHYMTTTSTTGMCCIAIANITIVSIGLA